ncbi:MAG TPA: cell division protein SepF [Lachnospiraceae bacterium]|nr:cell division protein SepF [Lachnospiraceae bacterium]
MGLFDKFLNAIKLNDDEDDFDDEEEFLDDEEEDEDYEDSKPKKRFFQKFSNDDYDEDADDNEEDVKPSYSQSTKASSASSYKSAASFRGTPVQPAPKVEKTVHREKAAKKSKVTPIRRKGTPSMEVNVIKPASMEDTKDIADTLMESCTVVLNLEGLDTEAAQRIIDFTCGACYSLGGSLQKITSYIFILTPSDVDISGDVQSILSGAFDIPSMKSQY